MRDPDGIPEFPAPNNDGQDVNHHHHEQQQQQQHQLKRDDRERDDPQDVEELLSRELLQLSMKERTKQQEEIHGVHCNAPKETPEFLRDSLRLLQAELEGDAIPQSAKRAYLKSQKLANTYVNGDAFRLRFLRSALFSTKLAARRIVEFLELAEELFGEAVLERPVRIGDFSTKELTMFRMGRYQFAPFRDRAGRRIMCVFPDEVWEGFPSKSKARMSLYISWTAGDDVNTQREGLVFLVWFDKEFKIRRPKPLEYRDHQLHTVRASAIHVCSPDTPVFRFRRAITAMRIGNSRRSLQIHLGTSIEILYILQSYGIPIDQIPISYTGKVKVGYMKQWIRVRSAIENSFDKSRVGKGIDMSDPIVSRIIEYPNSNDVVFRPGLSNTCHAGNSKIRNLIQAKLNQLELEKTKVGGKRIHRKKMISDIIEEIKEREGGRFLVWNDFGGWIELLDEAQIHNKVEHLIKYFRKGLKENLKSNQKLVNLQGGTSMFQSNSGTKNGKYQEYNGSSESDDNGSAGSFCCVR